MLATSPKGIRQNKVSIDELEKQLLQDHFELILDCENNGQWRNKIKSIVDDELSRDKHHQVYDDISSVIKWYGEDSFTIKRFDTTAITALLIYHNRDLGIDNPGKLITLWYAIRESRNDLGGHSTSNESDYEIFVWASIALGNLLRYIREVQRRPSTEPEKVDAFVSRYKDRIERAQLNLQLDYENVMRNSFVDEEFYRALQEALNSDNPDYEFSKRTPELLKTPERYHAWIKKASSMGFRYAHQLLASEHYKKAIESGLPGDYEEAARLYELAGIESLDEREAVRYASLHLNGLIKDASKEKGEALLESLAGSQRHARYLAQEYAIGSLLKRDYEKAGQIFESEIERLCLQERLLFASICANGLYSNISKAEGELMLSKLEKMSAKPLAGRRWYIEPYRTEEGHLFYDMKLDKRTAEESY